MWEICIIKWLRRNKDRISEEIDDSKTIKKRIVKECVKSEAIKLFDLKHPFTTNDIRRIIGEDLWNHLYNSSISKTLKDDLWLSYK